jgi:hypothetical protein
MPSGHAIRVTVCQRHDARAPLAGPAAVQGHVLGQAPAITPAGDGLGLGRVSMSAFFMVPSWLGCRLAAACLQCSGPSQLTNCDPRNPLLERAFD